MNNERVNESVTKNIPWDVGYNNKVNLELPFTPENGYVSMQNPPAFKWRHVKDASYELIIAADKELKDVKYYRDNIKNSYLCLEKTLDVGLDIYWAVKYKKNGEDSGWSTIRKFRIDPDAHEFIVKPTEELLEKIPISHPRIWIKQDQLDEFRTYKDVCSYSKKVYDYVIKKADKYVADNYIQYEEPELRTKFDTDDERLAYRLTMASLCNGNINRAYTCAYAYLMTGKEIYARFAIKSLLAYTSWDAEKGISAHVSQDQANRAIAFQGAMVYDWVYPLLTDEEKEDILNMIRIRTKAMEYLLEYLGSSPYDSHGWTCYGYIGIIAMATYGEIPEAADWMKIVLEGYGALLPVWGYQDGGWSQGTAYGCHSRGSNYAIMRVLAKAGIVQMHDSAYVQNEYLWDLYTIPPYGWGSFGDEGFKRMYGPHTVRSLMEDIYFSDNTELNGIRKWMLKNIPYEISQNGDYAMYWQAPKVEAITAKAPHSYQRAHAFRDVGWAVMSSDLMNPECVLLTFKSSPYGSYNHSHPDQNSFFIQAYGEALATRSGHYDAYHTTHDANFTRKTGAHNSVTVATNIGQRDDDMSATGHLTGFLTHTDFDLVIGDATEAYKGELCKFERNILYIRPDIFIVVDDLKASVKNEGGSQFEWWLNAESAMEIYETGNGVRITEGAAILDTIVQYPKKVKTHYADTYSLSDGKVYNPTVRYTGNSTQSRIWFETQKVFSTKMIVTMDVHRNGTEARKIETEYFDTYVKMTFEEGAVVIVNLLDSTEAVVTPDGVKFAGEAVMYNRDTIMLVNGTMLSTDGFNLLTLKKRASVVIGKDELCISTYEDNEIVINTANKYIGELNKVTDYHGRELTSAIGIVCEKTKQDTVKFSCIANNYELLLNGKNIIEETATGTVKVIIDGIEQEVLMNGYKCRNGEFNYLGSIDMKGKRYKAIKKSENITAGNFREGEISELYTLTLTSSKPDGQYVEYETYIMPEVALQSITARDYDSVKDILTVFVEAEDYVGRVAEKAIVYATRAFSSGNQEVRNFNKVGTHMNYEVQIPKEGDYSFVVKYVAYSEDDETPTVRNFILDGVKYTFTAEVTGNTAIIGNDPENWRVLMSDKIIHLKPGKYSLSFGVESGNWEYDWFGFIIGD